MRGQTAAFWLAFGEGALLLLMFLWMPVMGGARAFFGVRVEEETLRRGQARIILRRYRWTLAAIVVVVQACGYLLAVRTGSPLAAVLASLVTVAAGFITYNCFARTVRPLMVANTATRFASSLHARRMTDYTRAWVEAIVVLATVAPFVLLAICYASLPDPLPVHWDASGNANGWAAKSAMSVFFLPALGVYTQICFLVLKYDLAHSKLTLPAEHTDEYLRGKERFMVMNVRIMDQARVFIALLLLFISLLPVASVEPTLHVWQPYIGGAIWVSVAAMLGSIFFSIWRASSINRELQQSLGDWYVQRSADEARWQSGGLNYSNPEDSALMVEKLIGIGYTYNTAHPAFPARLVLLVGVPLFVVWAASSF